MKTMNYATSGIGSFVLMLAVGIAGCQAVGQALGRSPAESPRRPVPLDQQPGAATLRGAWEKLPAAPSSVFTSVAARDEAVTIADQCSKAAYQLFTYKQDDDSKYVETDVVTTTKGPVRLKEAYDTCTARSHELDAIGVEGCGVANVEFNQFIDGRGQYTTPNVIVIPREPGREYRFDGYHPDRYAGQYLAAVDCAAAPKPITKLPANAPLTLAELTVRCGDKAVGVVLPAVWETFVEPNGIRSGRRLLGQCLYRGALKLE